MVIGTNQIYFSLVRFVPDKRTCAVQLKMSAKGQKQTLAMRTGMSALVPKPDSHLAREYWPLRTNSVTLLTPMIDGRLNECCFQPLAIKW